jgi:hypothetical protein
MTRLKPDFDPRCAKLVEHFFPDAPLDFQVGLADRIQDLVEEAAEDLADRYQSGWGTLREGMRRYNRQQSR